MAARGTRGLALDDLHKDASPTVSLPSANGEVSSKQIGARHAVARERIRAPRSQNYGSTARPPRFVPRDSDPEVRAHFRFDRVVCSNLANNAAGETSFSWRGGHLVGAARDAAPRAQTTSAHGASGHFRDASLMALWRPLLRSATTTALATETGAPGRVDWLDLRDARTSGRDRGRCRR
jgi:hypothetical protein